MMDGRIDGWKNRWMWRDKRMARLMNGRWAMDKEMGGWMDGRIDGRKNKWIVEG